MRRKTKPSVNIVEAMQKENTRISDVFTKKEFKALYKLLGYPDTDIQVHGNTTSVSNMRFAMKYLIARIKEIDENKRLLHETVAVEVRRVVKGVTFVDNITTFWDHNATYNGGMQRVIRTHTAFGPEYSIFISCPNEDNQYEVGKIPIQGAEIQLFDILETTFPQLLFVRDPKKVAEEFRKILYSKLK